MEVSVTRIPILHHQSSSNNDYMHQSKESFRAHGLDGSNPVLHPRRARLWAIWTMSGSFLAATAIAIGHHIFLSAIEDQDVVNYSQFWIKNASNAFATAVTVCLGLAATTSLTHIVWRIVGADYISINFVNDMFTLPSPFSILSLLRWPGNLSRIPILVLAVIIHSLVIVSTFAPNALTIGSRRVERVIPAPGLDLSSASVNNLQVEGQLDASLMPRTPEEVWQVPPECASGCTFEVDYLAPGASCRDLTQEEITLVSYNSTLLSTFWEFYQSLSGEYPGSTDASGLAESWRTFPFNLTLQYVPFIAHTAGVIPVDLSQTRPPSGQVCHFYDRTYRASFTYHENIKEITTYQTSDTNNFNQTCDWAEEVDLSSECTLYAANAAGISESFAFPFQGRFRWSSDVGLGRSEIGSPYALQNIISLNNDSATKTVIFSAKVSNLSQALEQSFTNVTLSTMLRFNQTQNVSAFVQTGNVWKYNRFALWVVYLPAIVSIFVFTVYSLCCIVTTEVTTDSTFSSFFSTTRHLQLLTDTRIRFIGAQGRLLSENRHQVYEGLHSFFPQSPHPKTLTPRSPSIARTNTDNTAPTVRVASRWIRLTIVASFATATVIAIGHHYFLSYLGGRYVDQYSQFWIKNVNNLLARIVGISLGLAAASALMQAVWHTLRFRGSRISTIDNLFSLPEPIAIMSLLSSTRNLRAGYLIVIALAIQGLVLVGVLAPNALTIKLSGTRSIDLEVPGLDLSSSSNSLSSLVGGGNIITTVLDTLVREPPEDAWDVPADCEAACSFSIQYQAPALACRDLDNEEYTVAPQQNTSLSQLRRVYDSLYVGSSPTTWSDSAINFLINYEPFTYQLTDMNDPSSTLFNITGAPVGTFCTFRDATYASYFQYANNTKTMKTTISSYSNSFSSNCNWLSPQTFSPQCKTYSQNSLTLSTQFLFRFIGTINVTYTGVEAFFRDSDDVAANTIMNFQDTKTGTFTISASENATLTSRFDNLTDAMVQLFSNITLGLLPTLNQTIGVAVDVNDGRNIWKYDVLTLWYIYATSLGSVLVIALYGLRCIHLNGMPMDADFRTMMITTRTDELDKAYDTVQDYDELMETKLIYDQAGHFVVWNTDSDSMELNPMTGHF